MRYELSENTRKRDKTRGRTQSRTQIEASGRSGAPDLSDMSRDGKNGLVIVKEIEIR
jgi:hypothetical protein